MVVSPLFFPFLWLGIWRSGCEGGIATHRGQCQGLIATVPLLVLVVHSVLWWRGRMASNGELRYLLVVAPFWTLLAAKGWEWLFERMDWRRPVMWAAVAALAPLGVNAAYPVVPLKEYEDTRLARQVSEWYRSDERLQHDYPRFTASCTAVYLMMDASFYDRRRTESWRSETFDNPPPGTLLVWDAIFGQTNADASLTVSRERLVKAGWIPYKTFAAEHMAFEVFLSPRTHDGRPTGPR